MTPQQKLEERIRKCNLCDGAYYHNPGYIGTNYGQFPARLMILGYCSDARAYDPWLQNPEEQMAKYIGELQRCQTGFFLSKFFKMDGLSWDDIAFVNAYKCLKPGDKKPTEKELRRCSQQFLPEQLEILQPDGIIVLGKPTGRVVAAKKGMITAEICEIPHPGSRDFSKKEREDAFSEMLAFYQALRSKG